MTESRQLHPWSPLIAAAPVFPAALIVLAMAGGGGTYKLGLAGIPLAVVLSVAVMVVALGYRYLAWKKLRFYFDDTGDLRVDSGVLFRNERRLQLSRLQSVDVTQPLLARIVGLATLRVEVAGSSDSRVNLSYLSLVDAQELRKEILDRAAGLHASSSDSGSSQQAPAVSLANEQVLTTVPAGELALSLLLRTSTAALLGLTAFILISAYVSQGVAGLALVPLTGGVPIFLVVVEFMALFGFTVSLAGDGLRLRHGLLQTQASTVPPGRVAAIDVISPLLWRPFAWVRVRVTVAGVQGSDNDQSGTRSILLPVATRTAAAEIIELILPGAGPEEIALDPVRGRAKWRAPLQWRNLGVGYTDDVFVTQRGWLTKHRSIVPHARTQSVRVEQGPTSRLLGLASMHVDVAPGPVRVVAHYRPQGQARLLADEQAHRAGVARSIDHSTHWARHSDPQTSADQESPADE